MTTMARWDTTLWSASVLARAGLLRPCLPDQALGMGLALRRYGLSTAAIYAVGAARSSRRPALIDGQGTLSFGELDDRTANVAAGLVAGGVRPGDRVAVLCRNGRGFVQATVGLAKTGADAVFLNTGMAGPQLAQVFAAEGASAIILDEEFGPAAAGLGPAVPRITVAQIERLAVGPRRRPPAPDHSGGQIILTSGTTGTPKGAQRSRSGGIGPLVSLLSAVPLRRGDVTYVAAPLFHAWGFAHLVLAGVLGSTLVVAPRFDPEATLRAIEEHQVTALVVVPVMLQRIMDLPESTRSAYDTSSLRVAVSSGSALPGGLATRFMDAFGDVLFNLYGSTEVAWVSVASPADLRAAPATAGRPPRGTVVKLLDRRDEEVAPASGRRGRIFVGHDLLFSGYTGGGSKSMVDGLMATGDTGHFDDRGRLFVDGRDDDMIVSGGENVFPSEVEEVLLRHPARGRRVRDRRGRPAMGAASAGVRGGAGRRCRGCGVGAGGAGGCGWGAVGATSEGVGGAGGAGGATSEELQALVRATLASYKVPRDVVFVDELPRNATGKILRRRLAGW